MTEPTSETDERSQALDDPALEIVAPEGGLQTIYSNNVSINASYWDLRMDFGLVEEATEERVLVRNQVRIHMSPQHARVFAEVLAKNIENYETRFGSIPRPVDLEES